MGLFSKNRPAEAAPPNEPAPESDTREAIQRSIDLLFEDGQGVELRCFDTPDGTVSFLCNDKQALVDAAMELDGKVSGVFVTLNPISPELINLAPNTKRTHITWTANDSDVLRYRWLFVDLDPKRPKDTSSTENEHDRASAAGTRLREKLRAMGWPDPLLADSGNGAHLDYRIDLPNDAKSKQLVKSVLRGMATLMEDDTVEVDLKTSNPSRLCRLYGTMTQKGPSTRERPHRRSRIIDPPSEEIVPRELLEAVAELASAGPSKLPSPECTEMQTLLETAGFEVTKSDAWEGGWLWVFTPCPYDPDHTDKSAYIVRGSNGRIVAKCHHASCKGHGWSELARLLGVPAQDSSSADLPIHPDLYFDVPEHPYEIDAEGVHFTESGHVYSLRPKQGVARTPVTLRSEERLSFADKLDLDSAGARESFVKRSDSDAAVVGPELLVLRELVDRARIGAVQRADTYQGVEEKPSHATLLVQMTSGFDFFSSPQGQLYAQVTIEGKQETWSLKNKRFEGWLRQRFFDRHGTAPSGSAVADAIGVLTGRALGSTREVFRRVAICDDVLYLDLNNDEREVVEVTSGTWGIVSGCSVAFARNKASQALPRPVLGSNVDELRAVLNCGTDDDWILISSWLLGTLNPNGAAPILILNGEKGSAKTTTARLLRTLVDPSAVPLRPPPDSSRDLAIRSLNEWVIAFDNLSSLRVGLSDDLCRLSTGSGFGTRALYTDDDELLIAETRPIMINGIEEIATRGDLIDRSLIVTLPRITGYTRRLPSEIKERFESIAPGVLGALLSAVADGIARADEIRLQELPRMAEFARFITAAEPTLGREEGTFLKALARNQAIAMMLPLETSTIYEPLRRLLEKDGNFQGTATELLETLEKSGLVWGTTRKGWPRSAKSLANHLRNLAPSLRSVGIQAEFERTRHQRTWRIWRSDVTSVTDQSCDEGDVTQGNLH